MVPEVALRKYLASKTEITDLVGTRIYNSVIPQGNTTYPVLVYNLLSSIHEHHKTAAAGCVRCRFQLDCYSTSNEDVVELAEVLRQNLQMYKGNMGTLYVSSVHLDDEQSLYELPVDASDHGVYRKIQDYLIKFQISIPSP